MSKKKCRITTCPYYPRVEVKYEGTYNTDVVIVGESPGAREIEVGRPFIGPSGQVLNAILESIGTARDQVLIANSCRCQIDKEKDNLKMQNLALKTCREYLVAAINKAKPKVIVCLGAFALQQILKKKKLLENRGQFFWSEEFNCQVFVTVHPAYVLRGAGPKFWEKPEAQRSMKENLLFMDFGQVKKFLETGVTDSLAKVAEGYREGTEEDLDRILKETKTLAVDFETTGLNHHDPSMRALSVAFCDEPGRSVVFFPKKSGKFHRKVLKVLESPKITKLVASRPFDENVCKKQLGITMGGVVHDVLVLAHLLDENYTRYNLESVADIYTPLKGIKSLAMGMRAELSELPKEQLLKYNAVDADATLRAYRAMKAILVKDAKLARYYVSFILKVQDMFTDINMNGGLIDVDMLRRDEEELNALVKQLSSSALALIPPAIKLKYEKNLKLSRPELIRDYLFTHRKGLRLKPNPKYVTPKGKLPQCTEDHLRQFSNVPFIEMYLRMKKAEKIIGTYIKNYWKAIKDDEGRVYPSTFLNSTVTGRTVMKDPTIQTVPQRGEFAPYAKRCFVAPKGWLFGARDLGQSEIRIMGWLAQDPNILGALRDGIDIHTKTASIVNKVPLDKVTKDMRQKAKGVNFGFLYGMSAASFKWYAKDEYGLEFTDRECEEVRKSFFAAPNGYFKLPQYHAQQERRVLQNGMVRSPLGRIRRLPNAFSRDNYERGNAARQGINMPIQSFSSDLGLIGMMLFWRKIKEKNMGHKVKPLWFIHDSVMFQAPAKLMPAAMALLKRCMEVDSVKYLKEKFGIDVGYPVTSDGKAGQSWAALKEWDDKEGRVK